MKFETRPIWPAPIYKIKNNLFFFIFCDKISPSIVFMKGGVEMSKIAKIFFIGLVFTVLINQIPSSVQASEVSKRKESRWVKGEGTVLTGSFNLKAVKNPAHERGNVYYEESSTTGTDKIKGTIIEIYFDGNKATFSGYGYKLNYTQNYWEPGYHISGWAKDNKESPDQFSIMWCKGLFCETFFPTNLTSGFINIH